MIAEAESTCLREKSPSIMDGNPADWEACVASLHLLYIVPAPILPLPSSYHALHHVQVVSSGHATSLLMLAFFLSYSTPHAPRRTTALPAL